jgi:thioester reductase-like protein
MQYFVTGATGFIGKRLVRKLLERKGSVVHFLIRRESTGAYLPRGRCRCSATSLARSSV